ncbi:MAG TPA: C39 family peptidase [Anaerolineales bacterium]|nr:C39 family peptidase [Anaerolineales bacterium]
MRRHKYFITFFILCAILMISTTFFYSAAAQSNPEPNTDGSQSFETDFSFSLPIVFRPPDPTPIPPPAGIYTKTIFCSKTAQGIPNNNQGGVMSTINIDDPRFIADLDVRLDIDHSWVGDLFITLRHEESGQMIEIINRPGSSPGINDQGCKLDNIKAILDDDVSLPVENECSSYPVAIGVNDYIETAIAGSYIPDQPLTMFDSDFIAGNWTLTVSDLSPFDSGRINQWCLGVELTDSPVVIPTQPPPSGLPRQVLISGVNGQGQALPLDCESRSAVDWANFFGVKINEYEFFDGLPPSENPDRGFVGNVRGTWGQIPPFAYGVHAEPIAKRLRKYGLPADAQSYLSWNHLKAEISNGKPVIVWIVGSNPIGNGIPVYYQSSDGHLSTVARYEHTVVLTGYTQDSVFYLNGGTIYEEDLKQFLESWSALGNMAVIWQP